MFNPSLIDFKKINLRPVQVLEAESNARQMPEGSDQRAEMLGVLEKGMEFGGVLWGTAFWGSRVLSSCQGYS